MNEGNIIAVHVGLIRPPRRFGAAVTTFGAKFHRHFAFGFYFNMQVLSGTIIDGKVVVEGLSLPDGTAVTVLARGDEAVVKLSPEEEADLLAALDEADREEGIPAADFFARLRRFG